MNTYSHSWYSWFSHTHTPNNKIIFLYCMFTLYFIITLIYFIVNMQILIKFKLTNLLYPGASGSNLPYNYRPVFTTFFNWVWFISNISIATTIYNFTDWRTFYPNATLKYVRHIIRMVKEFRANLPFMPKLNENSPKFYWIFQKSS